MLEEGLVGQVTEGSRVMGRDEVRAGASATVQAVWWVRTSCPRGHSTVQEPGRHGFEPWFGLFLAVPSWGCAGGCHLTSLSPSFVLCQQGQPRLLVGGCVGWQLCACCTSPRAWRASGCSYHLIISLQSECPLCVRGEQG